ncbi:MAG: RNA polymerase sigma factor [Hylemonella sp.]|nr:RNA polymerase sigma factor [Hylemonella sp.]
MAEKKNTVDSGFTQGAAQAAQLLGKGVREKHQAAEQLLTRCAGRLKVYIRRHSYGHATEEDAEDLLSVTLIKFLESNVPAGCAPDAWLLTICKNVVLDWARKRQAEKRGGKDAVNVALDDDEDGNLLETLLGVTDLPAWVRLCVHKAMALMQLEKPERAEVLLFVAEGWTAEEIAVYFGADPNNISKQDLGAARDRKYRACQDAREYFEPCKE